MDRNDADGDEETRNGTKIENVSYFYPHLDTYHDGRRVHVLHRDANIYDVSVYEVI